MTPLEENAQRFSPVETLIYQQVRDFKEEDGGLDDRANQWVDAGLERVADRLEKTGVGDKVSQVAGAILDVLNDVSIWSVREQKIWENFQDAGRKVEGIQDVRELALEDVEDALARLELKYRVAAFLEGVSVGSLGLAGVLADVPAVVGMGLRAIAEYATYYGVDVTQPDERPFALLVLAAATASGKTRQEIFERIERYATAANRPGAGHAISSEIANEVAEQLAVRLVRGKIGQSVPLAGALVGGSYNETFVHSVCQTAQQLFRERWLLRKYAPSDSSD